MYIYIYEGTDYCKCPKTMFLCVPYVFPVIVGGVDRFVLRDSKTCGKASESYSFCTNSIDYVQ